MNTYDIHMHTENLVQYCHKLTKQQYLCTHGNHMNTGKHVQRTKLNLATSFLLEHVVCLLEY